MCCYELHGWLCDCEKKTFFLFPEDENFARNGFVSLIARIGHLMKMKIMNCFCGMVDQRKTFSLISSWDHCHCRKKDLSLSSDFVE